MSTLGRKMPKSLEWRKKVSASRTGKKYPKASLAVMGEKNPSWKGAEAKKTSGNKRAQRKFPFGKDAKCNRCPRTKNLVRHHKNENTLDNRSENIEILCRPCHRKHHHG